MRTRLLTGFAAAALVVAACETDDDPEPDAPTEEPDEDVDDEDVGDDTVDDNDTVDDEGVDEEDVTDEDAVEDDEEAVEDDEEAVEADAELLQLGDSEAGEHVVDREGMTVYIHALDELEDFQPTCTGDCAALWTPVVALQDDPHVGEGLDPELVGTVEREDAEVVGVDEQLTYGGYPLYRFASDATPGEARGHELADIWFVIDADGEPLGEVPDEEELEELDVDEEEAEE